MPIRIGLVLTFMGGVRPHIIWSSRHDLQSNRGQEPVWQHAPHLEASLLLLMSLARVVRRRRISFCCAWAASGFPFLFATAGLSPEGTRQRRCVGPEHWASRTSGARSAPERIHIRPPPSNYRDCTCALPRCQDTEEAGSGGEGPDDGDDDGSLAALEAAWAGVDGAADFDSDNDSGIADAFEECSGSSSSKSDGDDSGGDGDAVDALFADGPGGADEALVAAPPSPQQPGAPPQPAQQALPANIVEVSGGNIRFFASNLHFQAKCNAPGHGARCTKTRTSVAGRKQGQGRPLGFLAAWLARGPTCATAPEHAALAEIDVAERKAHRASLRARPEADFLRACERAPKLGEESEPERVAA